LFPQAELNRAVLTTLAGYLVFDALIGNTDRHHENWAILLRAPNSILEVAPSFDHASSLGRELQDSKRLNFLQNHRVEDYVRRGRGAIYLRANDARGANPLGLVEYGTRQYAEYFFPILMQLHELSPPDFKSILDCVPEARMSEISKAFALAYMSYTYVTLCKLIK